MARLILFVVSSMLYFHRHVGAPPVSGTSSDSHVLPDVALGRSTRRWPSGTVKLWSPVMVTSCVGDQPCEDKGNIPSAMANQSHGDRSIKHQHPEQEPSAGVVYFRISLDVENLQSLNTCT
eukprot:3585113-Pyramimonas_sp.AAC.1